MKLLCCVIVWSTRPASFWCRSFTQTQRGRTNSTQGATMPPLLGFGNERQRFVSWSKVTTIRMFLAFKTLPFLLILLHSELMILISAVFSGFISASAASTIKTDLNFFLISTSYGRVWPLSYLHITNQAKVSPGLDVPLGAAIVKTGLTKNAKRWISFLYFILLVLSFCFSNPSPPGS